MDDLNLSVMRHQAVKYMNVASMAVLVFDYVLTLDREITLVWSSQWGMGKVLFLLARYPAFFDVPLALYYVLTPDVSPDRCLSMFTVASWATVFGISVAEAILFLRTYALYANSRKMLIFLLTLFVGAHIPVVVVTKLFLRSVQFHPPPSPLMSGCGKCTGSKIIFIDYLLIMLLETIIVCLTLFRAAKTRHSNSPLLQTLYRDGLFYFVYLFFISVGNVVALVVGPPALVGLLKLFQRVMHSVLATRIMLHIRSALHFNNTSSTRGSLGFQFTTLDFSVAENPEVQSSHLDHCG